MSTAPNGYVTPKTNWQSADVVLPGDVNRIEGNISAIETGERTIDQSQAPAGLVGTLRQLLDWLANRIKAITGATNWYDAPPTTLATAKSHIEAAAPHSGHETPAGAQAKVDAHAAQAAPHSGHETPSGAQAKVNTAMTNHLGASDPHPQYALDSDLSAHKNAPTLDHPDGSVTLAKIASAAMTSAGGTEAGRLAVTNASGRVGAAATADTLAGRTAKELVGALLDVELPSTAVPASFGSSVKVARGSSWCITATHVFTINSSGQFKKVERATGVETTLAALPSGYSWTSGKPDIVVVGSDKLLLITNATASPYHQIAIPYTISSNSFGTPIDFGENNASAPPASMGCWNGGDYVYVAFQVTPTSGNFVPYLKRIQLSTYGVTQIYVGSTATSSRAPQSLAIFGGKIYVKWDGMTGKKMNLDGSGVEDGLSSTFFTSNLSPERLAWWDPWAWFGILAAISSVLMMGPSFQSSWGARFLNGDLYIWDGGSNIYRLRDPLA